MSNPEVSKEDHIWQLFIQADAETMEVWERPGDDRNQSHPHLKKIWTTVGEAINDSFPDDEEMGVLAARCYRKSEYWANPKRYQVEYKDEDPKFIKLALVKSDLRRALHNRKNQTESAIEQPFKKDYSPEALRIKLEAYFNLDELHTLCFDLQIDYEAIPGNNKQNKVREIILYFKRYKREQELLDYLRKVRPTVGW